jgi:hypothetical protein
MAGANSNIQLTALDFNTIKQNFITYLQGQSQFKDYNFEGSAIDTLLDVFAYNTQYNAFYLNMVANEMFLDSAVQRRSVVSHAKLLDYTPKSAICPVAFVNIRFTGVSAPTVTLPSFLTFLSEQINGVNYVFTNINPVTATTNLITNVCTFSNVAVYQGVLASYSFTVDSTNNPTYTFEIPDNALDTTTLKVIVQQSSTNSAIQVYQPAANSLYLTGDSAVYFINESLTGNYEISFGDGILGKQLTDGNIITVSYLSTEGTSAAGANSFSLMTNVGGYNAIVNGYLPATTGSDKESIASIKYQAPKAYAAQGRAVTKDDYISAIQQNTLFGFDAVNVWGGQENDPPVYGQVFVCLKPSGAYTLTQTQKTIIKEQILKPVSLMTVVPVIVDPDYNYIKITSNVLFNSTQTTYNPSQMGSLIFNSIKNFANTTLNTFNSTFSGSDLIVTVQNANQSIIGNEIAIQLQKKFYPNLNGSETYKFNFGVPLSRGILLSGVTSSPAIQYTDPTNTLNTIDNVYIDELPETTSGIQSISIINPGYSYQYQPTVTIYGDGTGATAEAILTNGSLSAINVTNAGSGYTAASIVITPAINDTSGTNGAAVVTLEGQYGTLRLYYYNANNVKTILNPNIGTIDYTNGIVTLNSFNPINVDNALGQLAITVNPSTTIFSSTFNRIITVDPNDSTAITVNVTAQ